MSKNNIKTDFISSLDGTAAVEFAIILPVLILLFFGSFEIGRVLIDYHAASKSIRDATRFLTHVGITCPGSTPVSGPLTSFVDSLSDEAIARNLALAGSVEAPTQQGDYLLSYWTDQSTISITIDCVANNFPYKGIYASQSLIPIITMKAQIPINVTLGGKLLNINSFLLTVQHVEAHVG